MKSLYRKILRAGALRFCKLYAIEQRREANSLPSDTPIKALYHLQNAVAAETIVREIVIERTTELYNKYDLKTTSRNEQTQRHTAEHRRPN